MDKIEEEEGTYRFGEFSLNTSARVLRFRDRNISLTPKRYELLLLLARNGGRIVPKDEFFDSVWGDTFVAESTLARNISWLRKNFDSFDNDQEFIETVPTVGYRFTADVIFEKHDINFSPFTQPALADIEGAETPNFSDAAYTVIEAPGEPKLNILPKTSATPSRRSYLLALLIFFAVAIGFVVIAGFVNSTKGTAIETDTVFAADSLVNNPSAVPDGNGIKIGSVINLRNLASEDAGYLDAWGNVKDKPDFWIVPTELKFVSTHNNPNRKSGSGTWKILSATGKNEGETLIYGDRVHLLNMSPSAGYLDNCGYLKDMAMFKKFVDDAKFAVFTSHSEDRDNGTGIWIIGSDDQYRGNPVIEGAEIILENGFPGGGFLNTTGSIRDIPQFRDYDGARLVFIHRSIFNLHPKSGIWKITHSRNGSR